MTIKGIIFDFNGTLFWDTQLHNRAWDKYLSRKGMRITDLEKSEHMHGRTSQDIFEYITGRSLSIEEVAEMTEEKEAIYRVECEKQEVSLARGACELLESLVKLNVPIGLATASGKSNVDYFIEKFSLDQYFPKKAIIFDDGVIPGKPNPALFLIAMDALGLSPEDTLIFEDSISGVKAAENAGAGRIIIIDSAGQDYSWSHHPVIESFEAFDVHEFLSST